MAQSPTPDAKNIGAIALGQLGLMNKRRVTYNPTVDGGFPHLRFLPWRGTDVTFMQLNGAANFALTGPLTGCTVSVVPHGGGIWFFHANVAGGGGMGPGNRATKRMMIRNAGAIVGVPPPPTTAFASRARNISTPAWALSGAGWRRAATGSSTCMRSIPQARAPFST